MGPGLRRDDVKGERDATNVIPAKAGTQYAATGSEVS
jgi:hypothetical protein